MIIGIKRYAEPNVVYAKRPFAGHRPCWPIFLVTPTALPSPAAG